MRQSTLVFLVKKNGAAIAGVCLAMKKRGFGAGRWNGAGGKVEAGETVEAAARRETKEEIGVTVGRLKPVAVIDFTFPHQPEWSQTVYAYFAETWQGNPAESEEMKPGWFEPAAIPYDTMWPDDRYWLPRVLAGSAIKASFTFGPKDVILEQKIDLMTPS